MTHQSSYDSNENQQSIAESSEYMLPKRTYFVRHWKGELPLAKAFWVNFFLINVLVGIVALVAANNLDNSSHQHLNAFIGFILGVHILYIWQIVGTWRCASQYIKKTEKKGFAIAAKVFVLLGVFNTVVHFDDVIKLAKSSVQLASINENSKFYVSVSADERVLIINGFLSGEVVSQAKDFLLKHSDIELVSLNSQGGLIPVGRALGLLIKERELNTYTAQGCHSACTLAFVGGTKRTLNPGAKLGFHQYADLVDGFNTQMAKEQIRDKKWFLDNGVSSRFVKNMYREDNSDLWIPTVVEIRAAKLVHEIKKLRVLTSKRDVDVSRLVDDEDPEWLDELLDK